MSLMLSREDRDRAARIVARAKILKGEGWSSFDAFLRARVEADAAEWLATLPFGEAHEPEPGHVASRPVLLRRAASSKTWPTVYAVAQRWAPVFGIADYHEWGTVVCAVIVEEVLRSITFEEMTNVTRNEVYARRRARPLVPCARRL
jgi:hypothetical protein